MTSFRTARAMLGLLSALGWITVAAGVAYAVLQLNEPTGFGAFGILPVIYLVLTGLFLVAAAQVSLALVVTAENTGRMLELMLAKEAAQDAARRREGEAPAAGRSDVPAVPRVGNRVATYRGHAIRSTENGGAVNGEPFDDLWEAERHIDRAAASAGRSAQPRE